MMKDICYGTLPCLSTLTAIFYIHVSYSIDDVAYYLLIIKEIIIIKF